MSSAASENLARFEQSIHRAMGAVDWPAALQELEAEGRVILPGLLDGASCQMLTGLYDEPGLFRSRVVMSRHGYGRGEYQYFAYPLPAPVAQLRTALYPRLVPTANRWYEAMKLPARFPDSHEEFVNRCHAAGQCRPTPLLLQYGEDDYNCLHQDIYGELVFPIQAAVLLSRPGDDFSGGEFLLTEQRPRMQSRAEVMPLRQGDLLLFAVRERPKSGSRGYYRVNMRHGVSTVRGGHRHTLGIIFHDAA